jgi:predicted short-subunit dehydrogenase-like oxidoreductase (DUF2520 family)
MNIQSVNIIGAGNVGSFLATNLSKAINIGAVFSRSAQNSIDLATKCNCRYVETIDQLPIADINIVSVSDDAISEILNSMDKNVPTVHTSGSVGIEAFNGFNRCGVFYPLQTLTKGRVVDASTVPFLIEASDSDLESALLSLCKLSFSENAMITDSSKRELIHLAAVLVNNFTTQLFTEAKDILEQEGLDFSMLYPLMKETVAKTIEMGPFAAQTGPAKRKDDEVLKKQINKIDQENLKEVYRLISEMIGKKHATF